jgi:hypothetical protein
MVSSDDSSHIFGIEANKVLGTRTAIAKKPFYWYDEGKHAFIPIEADIIDKLKLTRRDLFTQEIVSEGILLRRFIVDEN